jgi:hypothetical protein
VRIAAFGQNGPAIDAMLQDRFNANALALDAERRRHRTRGPLQGIP